MMKKILSKGISLLLTVAMVLSLVSTSAFAADFSKLKVTGGEVVLDGTNPGTVTVSWTGTGDYEIYGIEGIWSLKETGATDKLKLTEITSEILTFKGMNYVDVPSGKLMWTDDSFDDPGVIAAGKNLISATYSVAADTPAGTYTVTYQSINLIGDDAENDMTGGTVSFDITVKTSVTPPAHTCTLTKVPAKAATCTEDGNIEYYQCSDTTCGKLYKDAAGTQEITKADTVIKAGHTDLKLYPAKDPTCDSDGHVAYWFCTGCNNYYFDNNGAVGEKTTVEKVAIPATGHKWVLVVGGYEEGATQHTVKCSVCGQKKDEAHADRPGDVSNKWESDKDNHWNVYGCGTIMNKAAHTWGEGVVTTPATCITAGEKTVTCAKCGYQKTETINATGHKYEWKHDETNHWQECSVCGNTIDKAEHTYAAHKCEDSATCTKAECGYVKLAGQHTWGEKTYTWNESFKCTAATKCDSCNEPLTETVDGVKTTVPATCVADGKDTYTATFTNAAFTTQTKEVTIDKLGHTYGAPVWSWSEDGKTATATFTCTREGCTAETTGHAQTVTATVSGKQKVAPTCTDKGTTTYTAKVTFETKDYTDTKDVQDIKALGHKLTKTAAKAATCTEAGNSEYYTCGTCGKFFSDKDGKNEIAKDSWVIKALGHKLTQTPAVTPTCEAGGNNEYWTCSVCHKVFKADKTTETTVAKEILAKDPTNHTGGTELRGAVAASCMTAGRTDDTYCKGCSKLTKAGDLIPPTGVHNYKDGVCTTCGSKQPADNATIKAAIKKVVADVVDVKETVEEALDKAIKTETDANTRNILEKLQRFVSGSSRSKLQAVYSVTMSLDNTALKDGKTLADGQNVTIAISEETYNALRSGAKIVESYLDKDGNAQTREINATLKQVGGGYTVTFASDKTAVYGLMTKTSSGGSSGSGSSYTSGQSFTTDLPADSINRVTVNGKKLDSKYYTVSSNGSGSIVTLTDAYLATLKAGKYTVKIENKTHVSTGTFTIKADGTLSSPKTADAGIALYAMLAVSSLMGTAVVSKKRRKA